MTESVHFCEQKVCFGRQVTIDPDPFGNGDSQLPPRYCHCQTIFGGRKFYVSTAEVYVVQKLNDIKAVGPLRDQTSAGRQ